MPCAAPDCAGAGGAAAAVGGGGGRRGGRREAARALLRGAADAVQRALQRVHVPVTRCGAARIPEFASAHAARPARLRRAAGAPSLDHLPGPPVRFTCRSTCRLATCGTWHRVRKVARAACMLSCCCQGASRSLINLSHVAAGPTDSPVQARMFLWDLLDFPAYWLSVVLCFPPVVQRTGRPFVYIRSARLCGRMITAAGSFPVAVHMCQASRHRVGGRYAKCASDDQSHHCRQRRGRKGPPLGTQ